LQLCPCRGAARSGHPHSGATRAHVRHPRDATEQRKVAVLGRASVAGSSSSGRLTQGSAGAPEVEGPRSPSGSCPFPLVHVRLFSNHEHSHLCPPSFCSSRRRPSLLLTEYNCGTQKSSRDQKFLAAPQRPQTDASRWSCRLWMWAGTLWPGSFGDRGWGLGRMMSLPFVTAGARRVGRVSLRAKSLNR